MFGLEFLDIVIGLMFVYLLLALLATALNEYIAVLFNLRGKELARGIARLLENVDAKGAVNRALESTAVENALKGLRGDVVLDSLAARFYGHPLIRPLATRRGWIFRGPDIAPRLPSYIPARTFAMALLDVLGYDTPDANTPQQQASSPPDNASLAEDALVRVMEILKRESPVDVAEIKGLLAGSAVPDVLKPRLLEAFTSAQDRLQHLHDSVEVWFNNAMDRVSGAYKRTVQGWLFVLGLVIAIATNADSIDMWRRLASNDELRKAMADRAARLLPALEPSVNAARHRAAQSPNGATPGNPTGTDTTLADTTVNDTTLADTTRNDTTLRFALADTTLNPTTDTTARGAAGNTIAPPKTPADSAWDAFRLAKSQVDSMELKLGWGEGDRFSLIKLLGWLLTAIAISLGAPFWFDLLNKVISIRGAGRSPEEKPKSPEGGPKRTAEHTPK
jgi:hypothetical protein